MSIFRLPTGAPAAAFLLDQIIACGGNTIFGLGIAGSLDPKLTLGDIVVASEALAAEGTSTHYGTPRWIGRPPVVQASIGLADQLVKTFADGANANIVIHTGKVWSTDAPFRERRKDIADMRAQGALAVDMESSAMYSVACFRGAKVCNVLVISDELAHGWQPGLESPDFACAVINACAVLSTIVYTPG